MNKTFTLTIAVIGVALLGASCKHSEESTEESRTPGIMRIACIGDSITHGRGGDSPTYSWRYPFWKKLIDANAKFDMVGSSRMGFLSSPDWADYKGIPFDRDHEAHWGIPTHEVRDALPNWLERYTPDIAIVQLGSNDFDDEDPVNSTKAEMGQIIDILHNDNPNVIILLGLPCQEWKPAEEMAEAFTQLAAEKTTPDSPVEVVEHGTGWISDPNQPGAHTVDWAHPNLRGDTKLAQNYFEAIAKYLGVQSTVQPPVATIEASVTSGPAPLRVNFDGSASSDPDGAIGSYGWDFADGSNRAGGPTVSHTFDDPGTYEVVLGVTDDQGATGSAAVTITVH
jgi:lysophospholipase L1-like esterase